MVARPVSWGLARLVAFFIVLAAQALAGSTIAGAAERHVMFILDASNSMWGQIDGTAKIDIAKHVLNAQFASLPEGTEVGLIAYGHRFDRRLNDCGDMELVGGYGQYNADQVSDLLAYVSPKGQTPIAATLEESVHWAGVDGEGKPVVAPTIVLITDGAESCDGDPCAAAAKLADAGIQASVHVVGFDLDDQQRALVGCIAESGNGRYFDARDAKGLEEALAQVAQIEMSVPEPVEPMRRSVFLDDFDGNALEPHWTVINPSEDNYIVENGELLAITSAVGGADLAETQNIFTLTEPLPDGDWDAVLTFKAEFKTTHDRLQFGLGGYGETSLVGGLWTNLDPYKRCADFFLRVGKRSGGEESIFDTPLANLGTNACDNVRLSKEAYPLVMERLATMPVVMSMHKRGRAYHFTLDLGETDDSGARVLYQTPSFTSLRPPGALSVLLGKWDNSVSGEIAAMIDSVEVFSVTP